MAVDASADGGGCAVRIVLALVGDGSSHATRGRVCVVLPRRCVGLQAQLDLRAEAVSSLRADVLHWHRRQAYLSSLFIP